MCLMVWIGTARPLPTGTSPEPSEKADLYCVEAVPADAAIRSRFSSPQVTYVGSHQGCGCGFNSGELAWQGFERVADAMTLLDAMTDDEREELLAAQRSRVRLRDLVSSALTDGPVELYACWAGDEEAPATREETIDPTWLTELTSPLEEGVRYAVLAEIAELRGS